MRIGGRPLRTASAADAQVALGAALCVRALRAGSVCVDVSADPAGWAPEVDDEDSAAVPAAVGAAADGWSTLVRSPCRGPSPTSGWRRWRPPARRRRGRGADRPAPAAGRRAALPDALLARRAADPRRPRPPREAGGGRPDRLGRRLGAVVPRRRARSGSAWPRPPPRCARRRSSREVRAPARPRRWRGWSRCSERVEGDHLTVALAAPTGKAAARLQEAITRRRRSRWTPRTATGSGSRSPRRCTACSAGAPMRRADSGTTDRTRCPTTSSSSTRRRWSRCRSWPGCWRRCAPTPGWSSSGTPTSSPRSTPVRCSATSCTHRPRIPAPRGSPSWCGRSRVEPPGRSRRARHLGRRSRHRRPRPQPPVRPGIGALAEAIRRGDPDDVLAILTSGLPDVEFLDLGPDAQRPPVGAMDAVRADVVAQAEMMVGAARAGDARAALEAPRGAPGALRAPRGPVRGRRLERAHRGLDRAPDRPAGAAAGPWYVGRPLIVTSNDYAVGLYNGDTGVADRHVRRWSGGRVRTRGRPDPHPPDPAGHRRHPARDDHPPRPGKPVPPGDRGAAARRLPPADPRAALHGSHPGAVHASASSAARQPCEPPSPGRSGAPADCARRASDRPLVRRLGACLCAFRATWWPAPRRILSQHGPPAPTLARRGGLTRAWRTARP